VLRLATAVAAIFISLLPTLPTAAQTDTTGVPDTQQVELVGVVDVLQVSGLIDPIEVNSIRRALDRAVEGGSLALVLQVNSSGATVSDAELGDLVSDLSDAPIVVGVWIGQSGASVSHEAVMLGSGADLIGISPGSRMGPIGDSFGGAPVPGRFAPLVGRSLSDNSAVDAGAADVVAATLGDFVLAFEDRGVMTGISRVVDPGAEIPKRNLLVQVRFSKLGLVDQLMHTVASPAVAYLLLLIGLSMILLDYFTAGIGVAGMTGAVSLLLAAYGLGVLPTRPLGLGLLVLAVLAFAVDVQTGVPRFWTGVGVLSLLVGSFTLYSGLSLSWLTLIVGIGLMLAFVFSGMPSLVRTRFSTTTIGREHLLGQVGVIEVDVDPDGVVQLDGALWRARTNRGTPLRRGDRARVTAIEGTVLEVEPEEGGAVDYREMRGRRSEAGTG